MSPEEIEAACLVGLFSLAFWAAFFILLYLVDRHYPATAVRDGSQE